MNKKWSLAAKLMVIIVVVLTLSKITRYILQKSSNSQLKQLVQYEKNIQSRANVLTAQSHQNIATWRRHIGISVNQGKADAPISGPYVSRKYPGEKGITIHDKKFYLDGSEFRILGGSFHYFRTHPQQWEDRLLKMRGCGLNTVSTYIPWNIHEPIKGHIVFNGFWNLTHFIELVHKLGFKMIVRPGPYICGEWEHGGLPSWLLSHHKLRVRTATLPYLTYVEKYFSRLLPFLAERQYRVGKGPIIAFQLENEFTSGERDFKYLKYLKQLYDKYKIEEVVFTADSPKDLVQDKTRIPGVMKAIYGGPHPQKALKYLSQQEPSKPMFVAEFYPGWFDKWSNQWHNSEPTFYVLKNLLYVLAKGASLNFYMFVGGTNFGFMGGAYNLTKHGYQSVTTSFDYDAPITEAGDLSEKYYGIKNLLQGLELIRYPPSPPSNSTKTVYGFLRMTQMMTYPTMSKMVAIYRVQSQEPLAMEYLDLYNKSGQSYGWLIYRTHFSWGKKLRIVGAVYDRAQIILNKKVIKVVNSKTKYPLDIKLKNTAKHNDLDIIVENLGRVSYRTRLNPQYKGLLGHLYIDDKLISNWTHIPLDFTDSFIERLSKSPAWETYQPYSLPSSYRGFLKLTHTPTDTFINMSAWIKGVVIVNGFNLGRYWRVGPQLTLFLPAPLLKIGTNEIIVFELHRQDRQVALQHLPILGWMPEQ